MAYVITLWDAPLRIFHWLLVLTISLSYLTGQLNGSWLDWHAQLGLFILALVVFRIVWGFVGSTHARFSDFTPTPLRIKQYCSSRRTRPGHSPLGALSIFTMLSLILAQAGSGLFAMEEDIEFYGPLCEATNVNWCKEMTTLHISIVNWLLLIITLHVSATTYHTFVKKNNLIRPMITGKITVADLSQATTTHTAGVRPFVFAVGISVLVVWLITTVI